MNMYESNLLRKLLVRRKVQDFNHSYDMHQVNLLEVNVRNDTVYFRLIVA